MDERYEGSAWHRLVGDVWAVPGLRERLVREPLTVLIERGLIPSLAPGWSVEVSTPGAESTQLRITEPGGAVTFFGIPPRPDEDELSTEQLASAVGGWNIFCIHLCDTTPSCGCCERCGRCGRCGRCRCGRYWGQKGGRGWKEGAAITPPTLPRRVRIVEAEFPEVGGG